MNVVDVVLSLCEETDDGCLMYVGNPGAIYPTVTWKGVRRPVHRIMAEDYFGPCPPGLEVDHVCGHKHCVRHLEYVTHSVNMQRAADRKRRQQA